MLRLLACIFQTVSKWERGIAEPDISVLGAIATALGVSVEAVLGVTEQDGQLFTGNFDAVQMGKLIANLRKRFGYSQQDLAQKIGVSSDIVSKWERGVTSPDWQFLVQLSAIFEVSPWVTAIVCLVMLAIYVVACFKANAVGEVVGDFEEKVKQETNFADYSIAVSSNLCKKATSTEVSDSVKKVYDALRYSPRRSHTQLAELEESILDHLQALDVAVSTNDVVAVQEETTQLLVMIDERNSKSKLYK